MPLKSAEPQCQQQEERHSYEGIFAHSSICPSVCNAGGLWSHGATNSGIKTSQDRPVSWLSAGQSRRGLISCDPKFYRERAGHWKICDTTRKEACVSYNAVGVGRSSASGSTLSVTAVFRLRTATAEITLRTARQRIWFKHSQRHDSNHQLQLQHRLLSLSSLIGG